MTRPRKGGFGAAELPVARRYLGLSSRRLIVAVGFALAAVVLLLVSVDFRFRGSAFISEGPLSSAHALLERDCAACHDPLRGVSSEGCTGCHEPAADPLGAYGWARHYLYRSTDFRRVVASAEETPCASCHVEHRGREADLTRVDSARCETCHRESVFPTEHPELQFVRDQAPDPSGLHFAHAAHVQRLMERRRIRAVEATCGACHQPTADGRHFAPIDFDRSCDACHLDAGVATPRLPLETADQLGVESLETIRASGRPGTEWAMFMNPSEIKEIREGWVIKTTLHHRDPWVLDNLRRLRSKLYDGGLADLLLASPDAPADQTRELYAEIVAALERQALGLRGRPEASIQAQLAELATLLDAARRRLDDPFEPLDETTLLLALETPRPGVDEDLVEEVEELAELLLTPCITCHQVERATLARVDRDQLTLSRAEFDHSAHVIQWGCLDCHRSIPIGRLPGEVVALPAEQDNAEVHFLPSIATCAGCHAPDAASAACVTCHRFHPGGEPRLGTAMLDGG